MYERFYGLSGNPFLLTPDARFFYPSKNHKRALAFLRYGVSKGEGFVVITGDVGTGKTTLVQMLTRDLEGKPVSVANIVTTQLADHELVRLVAANFNLKYRELDKVELLKGLEAYFRECARQGKRVLLIVDEAQNLPPDSIEELRMLSNLEFKGRPLLQTFLLGQEQLRARISTMEFEQLRQRITAVFHLGPMDVDETKDYIKHRLSCVGWDDDPKISNSAFLEIHRFTDGVPRRINNVCDRVLLFAYLEELHKIDEADVQVVLKEISEEYKGIAPKAPGSAQATSPSPAAAAVPADNGLSAELGARLAGIEGALREIAAELRALRGSDAPAAPSGLADTELPDDGTEVRVDVPAPARKAH